MALQQWYTEQPAVSRSVGLTLCLVLVHCPSSALPPTNHSFHLRTARAYLASYKINTTPLSTLLPHSQYVLLFLGLARARTYFFPAPTSTAVIPPFSPTYPPQYMYIFFYLRYSTAERIRGNPTHSPRHPNRTRAPFPRLFRASPVRVCRALLAIPNPRKPPREKFFGVISCLPCSKRLQASAFTSPPPTA